MSRLIAFRRLVGTKRPFGGLAKCARPKHTAAPDPSLGRIFKPRPHGLLARLALAGGSGGIALAAAKTMLEQPEQSMRSGNDSAGPSLVLGQTQSSATDHDSPVALFVKRFVFGLWEIVVTVLRSGELLFRFVPLLVAYPAVWLGQSGTLWWYGFLRMQMSSAGPTFVKLSQWAASRTDLFSAQL
ncbi:hypothetical protein LPJ56_005957, partial [Coemansia sp. RSA 2599]